MQNKSKGIVSQLLSNYGAVLEFISSACTCGPEQFLPASKETIKNELKKYYLLNNELESKNLIYMNYIHLAYFVPLSDALTAVRFENFSKQTLSKDSKKKPTHPEDQNLNDEYSKIQSRVLMEMKKLSEEFSNFIAEHG